MSNMLTITLDVSSDLVTNYNPAKHQTLVSKLSSKFGITSILVNPSGPAGGNPVYQFTGTKTQLSAFLTQFFGPNQINF
jgi:NAD(P)-dependent dehydrogenase (short-subunit alcohol dehydrogenase family)